MQLSTPNAKRGVDPTADMLSRTLIVSESETLCGHCGTEASINVNRCDNRSCGMLWLFVVADVALTDETTTNLWYRLCGERRGLTFIGVVGFDDDGYYLAEVCFVQGRPSWRQALRHLWLDWRRKDETR